MCWLRSGEVNSKRKKLHDIVLSQYVGIELSTQQKQNIDFIHKLSYIKVVFIYLDMTKLLLNGSPSVNYFIHGQELTLEFDFPKAWFVVVSYNQIPVADKFKTKSFWFWKRNTFFFRKKGIFKSYINHFSPKLEIRSFESWSIIPNL